MNWRVVLLWTALTVDALAGRRPEPAVIDDALAFTATDRAKTVRLLEDALEHDAALTARDRAWVMVHAGEQRRLLNETALAARWFRDAVQAAPDADIAAIAGLGTALLDLRAPIDAARLDVLNQANEKSVLATQNADRFAWLAIHAAYASDVPAIKDHTRKALSYAQSDPEVDRRIRAKLEELAGGKPPPPPEPARSPIERAEAAYAAGRREEALATVRELIPSKPESMHEVRVAQYLQRRIEANTIVHPERVGVLLPLSGKYGQAGKQMRQAIELGFGATAPHAALVFVDAGETPESVLAGLEKLVFDEGVVAVLGPLRNEGTAQVVEAAEAMRVPLVTLSQSPEAGAGASWAIQGMPTVRDQVRVLVEAAMNPPPPPAPAEPAPSTEAPPPPEARRPLTRFAIFAPDNAYGKSAAAEFKAEVERRGGTIWREALYNTDATDLVPFAKSLGGDVLAARLAQVERWRAEAKRRGVKSVGSVLEPLPFDAIFVPDNAQRVPLACAALAFVEIPIGDFQPSNEPHKVPLLGLSGWNNDTLIDRGGLYVQNSLFTDLWYSRAEGAETFIEQYRAALSRTPTPLEASTYDLAALMRGAADTRPTSAAAFRDALRTVHLDAAVSGTGALSATRPAVEHDLPVLTIEGKEIRPADTQNATPAAATTPP